MNFDFYYPIGSGDNMRPGIIPQVGDYRQFEMLAKSRGVNEAISQYRSGNKNAKKSLPAICYMGKCTTGKRSAAGSKPTGFVMIDLDHLENAREEALSLLEKVKRFNETNPDKCQLLIVHITPSGKGLRVIFVEMKEWGSSITDQQAHFSLTFGLPPIDEACKDLSRLSFLPKFDDIIYVCDEIWEREYASLYITSPLNLSETENTTFDLLEDFSEEEIEAFSRMNYRGHDLRDILRSFIHANGAPSPGEKHSYYNMLIKYFRCIANNDMRYLLWLLPSFGHSVSERWSQIKSICKVNTLSGVPQPFYAFLAKHGYLVPKTQLSSESPLTPDPSDDLVSIAPPVLKDLLSIAPSNFAYPSLCALLPILGTLTTYAQAVYPWDDRLHTTSFFSVIVAPPSAGKGFVDKYIDVLFSYLKVRDLLESKRERVYLNELKSKREGDAPLPPPTSQRIMPAKNSEAELLAKQWQNDGAHMFTFAAEMDSWAKGVRAAGGNKDDMIRVAWDNGEYGQAFRSNDTFKGSVKLYWNVLVTGTLQQTLAYFKNVENGLVSRVSFSTIEDTDFSLPQPWKRLNTEQMQVINRFLQKCDDMTYREPLGLGYSQVKAMEDDEVKQSPWRFSVLDKVTYDISWIMPTITEFNTKQINKSASNLDYARDMFRRRTCVRGFRLALLCNCLYPSEKSVDRELVSNFVRKFMEIDIENSLLYFGEEYNNIERKKSTTPRANVYASLPDEFTREDVEAALYRFNMRTNVRHVLYLWNKNKLISKNNEKYIKVVDNAR